MKLETERLEIIPTNLYMLKDSAYKNYIQGMKHIQNAIAKLQDDSALLGWGVWLVVDKESKEVLGDIGFKGKPVERTVEVGYGFASSARNKGYATESVRELIKWAFASNLVDKVVAECLFDNAASINVLEKLGFQRTGFENHMIVWELKMNPAS